jgi:hypothetical protein
MFVLVATTSDRNDAGRPPRFYVAWAAAAGFLAAWLHPWEGTIGVIVLAALSVWAMLSSRSVRVLRTTAVPLLATSAPLVYYLVLERWVSAWSVANKHVAGPSPSIVGLVAVLGPFAALGLFAGRGRDRTVDRLIRIWAVVAVGASLTLGTTVPAHFLASATLPLAILAVEGWSRIFSATHMKFLIGALAVAVFTIPGSAAVAKLTFDVQSARVQPHLVTRDEHDALAWLDHAPPGSVLAAPRLATAIPALTGHPTWFGHPNWTPDYATRAITAGRLFNGELSASQVAEVIKASAARYVLVDCASSLQLERLISHAPAARFGCATVFTTAR